MAHRRGSTGGGTIDVGGSSNGRRARRSSLSFFNRSLLWSTGARGPDDGLGTAIVMRHMNRRASMGQVELHHTAEPRFEVPQMPPSEVYIPNPDSWRHSDNASDTSSISESIGRNPEPVRHVQRRRSTMPHLTYPIEREENSGHVRKSSFLRRFSLEKIRRSSMGSYKADLDRKPRRFSMGSNKRQHRYEPEMDPPPYIPGTKSKGNKRRSSLSHVQMKDASDKRKKTSSGIPSEIIVYPEGHRRRPSLTEFMSSTVVAAPEGIDYQPRRRRASMSNAEQRFATACDFFAADSIPVMSVVSKRRASIGENTDGRDSTTGKSNGVAGRFRRPSLTSLTSSLPFTRRDDGGSDVETLTWGSVSNDGMSGGWKEKKNQGSRHDKTEEAVDEKKTVEINEEAHVRSAPAPMQFVVGRGDEFMLDYQQEEVAKIPAHDPHHIFGKTDARGAALGGTGSGQRDRSEPMQRFKEAEETPVYSDAVQSGDLPASYLRRRENAVY